MSLLNGFNMLPDGIQSNIGTDDPLFSIITAESDYTPRLGQWGQNWRTIIPDKKKVQLITQVGEPDIETAYKKGIEKAKADYLIFCHADAGSFCMDFENRLLAHFNSGADIVAGCGATKVTAAPWMAAGTPYVHGCVINFLAQPIGEMADGGTGVIKPIFGPGMFSVAIFGVYRKQQPDIQVADGFFLAMKRSVLPKVDWKSYGTFHMYDINATYGAFKKGANIVVANDLFLWHAPQSNGYQSPSWKTAAAKWSQENSLPLTLMSQRTNMASVQTSSQQEAIEVNLQLLRNIGAA